MIAPYSASSLIILFKPENKSQFELTKDHISIRMNDFLKIGGIPVILISIMLTFRDSSKSLKIDVELLETMINYDFNASQSNPQDQKLIYEFGKEMIFNIKQPGRKNNRDKSMIELLKSPDITASGVSKNFLSSDPNELCGRLKILLQQKQTGKISTMIDEETVAITVKLIGYKCISTKQQNQTLMKCNQ